MLVFSFDHSINGHSSHNAVNVPTPIILWGIFIAFAIWLVQFCIKTTGSVPAPAGVTPQEPVKGKHDIRKYIKWVMLGNILFLVVFYSAICLFIYATRYYHYVVQGEYWPGLVIVGGIIIALGATALQLLFGLIAIAKPVSRRRGTLAILTTPLYAFASAIPFLAMMGGGWGRPLRVKGQQVHPELREGSDWTQGPKPDPPNSIKTHGRRLKPYGCMMRRKNMPLSRHFHASHGCSLPSVRRRI
ncbi:MAG: hypothetical protein EB060_02455 [Proteobacteria bacterium]|nr:hypothetical protein [Pseudomonadota bacterium]